MDEELLVILGSDLEAIKKLFEESKPERKVSIEECDAQYHVDEHDVMDAAARPDKQVKKPTGEKDDAGNDKFQTSTEEVVRVPIGIQKLIVSRSVGFMLGNPIDIKVSYNNEINDKAEQLNEMVLRTWDDNKLDFQNREVARLLLRQCEVAELWYFVEDDKYWGNLSNGKLRMKMKVLSADNGDTMYPYYSVNGDLIAFAREFKTGKGDSEILHFDIYTAEKIVKWQKTSSGEWALSPVKIDAFGKIPIIYYNTEQPDWHDAQPSIERLEESTSNHGDTNDYNGAPILFAKGNVSGLPNSGSRGKAIQGSAESDAKYLNWDSMPESIKLEQDNLKGFTYEVTQTPDLSFDNLKGIGSSISGVALKLMFTDAHMKATTNWGYFGIGIQRRLNLLQNMVGLVIDSTVESEIYNLKQVPECVPYLPVNQKEIADMVDNGVAAGHMSKLTANYNHPMVDDPEQEVERRRIESEEIIEESTS